MPLERKEIVEWRATSGWEGQSPGGTERGAESQIPPADSTSQMPNLIAGVQIDKVAKHGRRVVDDAAHGRESLFERRVKGHRRHVGGRA
jgi:hypothetical protein